ncbi:MAG: ABC transporter ATP-binding protein [Ilumatobacter sp.]|uniref:ABC transporter ATP-binding protein n=1 Tax=Ilumatobacter sp. TaxID=1967498 RepID=UPI00261E0D0F|nr:ABC transporter ATP-binding protein [Ilumatobacter sp.]MDJ0768216.1 ABC transporter ATP-binding protein [Ilumatobacter sp.]
MEEGTRRRAQQYARFVRAIVRMHPRLFVTAVLGAFVFALCTVASSVVIRWVIDNVVVPRFEEGDVATSTVVTGCMLIIGIGLLRAVGVVVRRSFAHMTQWRIAETLTNDVTDRYVRQPASWHQRQSDGQLLARAGVDVDTTISVMAPIPFATSTILLLAVAAVWLLSVDLVMGLVAIAVFPLLMVVNVAYERRVNRHFDDAQAALGEFSGAVHESFEAVQLVKAYGAERRETERLTEMAVRIRDPRVKAVELRGTFEALLETVPSITNIGLVVLGATRVDSGAITIGDLSGFIYMFTLLVFPLRLIGYALSELPPSYAGYHRIMGVIDDPVEPDPESSLGVAEAPFGVVLDHVRYVYAGESQPAVADATAHIAAGSVTAFVGATGAGKSTLVELIAGLLEPTGGTVAVPDGPRALVFQEAFLFSGSVRDNVVVGDAFDDGEVWEALRLARAEGFVRELPDGLDTVVGERGVTLSGGQRQRVALARALVRRPALLILDDTTSALDPATELAVLDNLRTALAGTTVVMVALRPSTIALADDVLFVEGGRVVAHGRHAELMARVDGYRALVEAFESDRTGVRL